MINSPSRQVPAAIIVVSTILLAATTGWAQAADSSTIRCSGKTMGPIDYHVVIANPADRLSESRVQTSVQAALDRVNDLMSTYKPDSDISRFNRSDSTDWFPVSAETMAVVARALEISELTGGAFDITVAPAVNLWRFGPDKAASFELPTEQQIADLKRRVGYQQLAVRRDPPAIKKNNSATSIDLSAIAKGYAVDQVAVALNDLGCENYMVEVGGEVSTRGQRDKGGKWRIGIEKPVELAREIGQVAELSGLAMATSGDYRNFEVYQGQRYSHTIDPTTCKPVEHALATACVIANDCMTADAIATSVMVMGSEKGRQLCSQSGWELLTIARDSDFGDELTMAMTKSFPVAFDQNMIEAPSILQTNDNPSPTTENAASIWPTFIAAVVVISLAILGMAIGAIFGNKPVRGSCGGLANMTNEDGETSCGVCSKPTADCVEK